MSIYVLAFLIGVIAGLRSMTAPAVVIWGARLGWLRPEGSWLSPINVAITPYIASALAIGELIADKLPKTPSRKAPGPFIVRIIFGGMCGAALGAQSDLLLAGLAAGAIGAVAGTLGGYEARRRLVNAIGGKDLPIALLEDAVAVGSAFWIVSRF